MTLQYLFYILFAVLMDNFLKQSSLKKYTKGFHWLELTGGVFIVCVCGGGDFLNFYNV